MFSKIDFRGRARMIFALLGGILFLALQAIFPDLPITEEQTIAFMGLIAAYVLGEGLSGQTIGDNFKKILTSQKFQALIVGLIVAFIKVFVPDLAISDSDLAVFIGAVATFIVSAGVASKAQIPAK